MKLQMIQKYIADNEKNGAKMDSYLDKETDWLKIGFTTGQGVWYWFFQYEDSGNLLFDHRYSCNNGKSSRGRVAYKQVSKILNW
jgi:hypothetical protein